MEEVTDCELKQVMDELMQVLDSAKRLQGHLDPSSSPPGWRELIEQIISSYPKALTLLKSGNLVRVLNPTVASTPGMESPQSVSGSPRSENSKRLFKDQDRKGICKKRKTLPNWTKQVQVRVCAGTGLEGPLDDGFSWRKYGQKVILGAKYPRAYYRCTHRNVLGCPATKQVQRSDEDPSIFAVSYNGNHTCQQSIRPMPTLASMATNEPPHEQEMHLNFRAGLRVKTEDLDHRDSNSASFSFPSAPINNLKLENDIFSSSKLENNFMGSFSPPFISPATSESNYFSMSPCRMSTCGGAPNLHSYESDPNEIISAMTSAPNSPLADLGFTLDPLELDPDFPLDNFFS